MLTPYLNQALASQDLSETEMEQVMQILLSNEAPPSAVGALLAALRMKGESCGELIGAARFLRRHAEFIDTGSRTCLDIVGTGGDGGISFNISTTSSFVAAGAGVCIAKHGNRAVSGKSGAADVLAAAGFNLECSVPAMENSISQHGIGFLFAQKMHPLLGRVGPLRRELKIRTIFNMLGPLCNPAGAPMMVLGVYAANLTELFAEALRGLGVKRAMVVHGLDGLDEISCCAPTRVTELKEGSLSSYELFPEMLIGKSYDPSEIAGGTPEDNARLLKGILEGSIQGAPRDVVVLNAGAAIYTAGVTDSLQEGIRLAAEVIENGQALEKLNLLIEESHA